MHTGIILWLLSISMAAASQRSLRGQAARELQSDSQHSSGDTYAHYAFAWLALHDKNDYKCEEPGPAPELQCSGAGSIQLVKTDADNHKCAHKVDDPGTLVCGPQPDEGNLAVRCYGSNPDDLKLTVTLPTVNTKCNGMGEFPYSYASGWAMQRGRVGTLCGQGEEAKLLEMLEDDCNSSTRVEGNIGRICYDEQWCKSNAIMALDCSITLKEVVITTTRDLEGSGCIYRREEK